MPNDHDEIERAEAPSPRWVAQLRQRGHWPRSGELVIACTILSGFLALRFSCGSLTGRFVELLSTRLVAVEIAQPVRETLLAGQGQILGLLWPVLPLLLLPAFAAAATTIAQVGLRLHPEAFLPSPARFDVIHRLGAIASFHAAFNALVVLAKWLVLFVLVLWWLWGDLALIDRKSSSRPEQMGQASGDILLGVGTKLAVALVVLGAVDYGRAWWAWQQQTRMSRAELVAEMREAEGDPAIRRQRRHRQLQRGLARSDNVVKPECVVFLGKGKLAVATSALDSLHVTIIARGVGAVADHMRRAAQKCGARVIQDDSVARAIYRAGQAGDTLPAKVRDAIDRPSTHSQPPRFSPKSRV